MSDTVKLETDQNIKFKTKKRKQLRQRIKDESEEDDNIEQVRYFVFNIVISHLLH